MRKVKQSKKTKKIENPSEAMSQADKLYKR